MSPFSIRPLGRPDQVLVFARQRTRRLLAGRAEEQEGEHANQDAGHGGRNHGHGPS